MAKEVVAAVKEPNEVTYDLYDELMLRMDAEKWPDVIPATSAELTVAKVYRTGTAHHDLLFYRFAHHDSPIARITHSGDSMTMLTYEMGRSGNRFRITETDIQERLKELLQTPKVEPNTTIPIN